MATRRDEASRGARKHSGRSVGQFTIDKEIGKGSFAQVYMGYHKETKATVAIKSVDLERLNKKLKENLYGEIQILKTLRHPHIVALHDCLESSTHINLIMEYCELGDLSLFIKKRDKLITHPATHDMARKYPSAPNSGLHEVVIRHFTKQLISALEFLRQKNYVHRDVKPQNLLLLPSRGFRRKDSLPIMEASSDSLIPMAGLASLPMLKLADFGFARVLPQTSLAETLCGSPLYMAPEILRYEKYDAKADLWSVGTVIYEMATGRPPFRARNHVELLRKIEAAEDTIKFPKEVVISSELKSLIRSLLKRIAVERFSFESLFSNSVITDEIPGLVEDDVPKPLKRELETIVQREKLPTRPSAPRAATNESIPEATVARSPRARESIPSGKDASDEQPRRQSAEWQGESSRDGLGIRRPKPPHHPASMPHPSSMPHGRLSERQQPSGPSLRNASLPESQRQRASSNKAMTEAETAAQDVAFERDYVVVERRHVEVNALADELAANERLGSQGAGSSRGVSRRYTQQGAPTSNTGAVPTPPSQTALVAQGRSGHDRRSSYDKVMSTSPGQASSAISKAIQDASLRLFGYKMSPLLGAKGQSPPMYQAYPAYPTPATPAGLLGDGKGPQSMDEDVRAAHTIEELATRSDCVYGFAEVKYRQLQPLAPSMDQAFGGIDMDPVPSDEDGLTVEAVVVVSEEALVLYVKSLTLLARAMDIASVWWTKKSRSDSGYSGVSAAVSQSVAQRINAVVQWVRGRFNEVLEKSEVVRMKLVEAQKQLPEDHPSHPNNHGDEYLGSSSSPNAVFLTPGIGAEKLMYDRALEMSRAAAIDEVTNEDLPGCELSYVTAIRMLEAVLDNDDESASKRLESGNDDGNGDLDTEEEAHVRKMIAMITGRLNSVRKKMQMIAEASSRSQAVQPRRRSGDVTPRSVRSQASG